MQNRKFRFSRLFLSIIGSIVFLLFAAYSWGLQTMVWWEYKGFSKSAPILKLTPQSLPDAAPNLAEGTRLSHAGLKRVRCELYSASKPQDPTTLFEGRCSNGLLTN